MKKYLFTLMALLLFSSSAYGVASNRRYYHIAVMDQWSETITSPAITQVDVQNESGTAVAVYSTKSGTTEVGSTGVITAGLDDGMTEFWYAGNAIDLTVTDGTRTYEIESFSVRTSRFMLPSFLTSTSGNSLGQTDDLDFTFGSWILDGDTANRLDMIPDNDSAILAIGDGTNQADVYFYKSSTEWMFYDEGNGIFEMVGVNIDLDDASSLGIGSGDDFRVYSDQANIMEFDPAAAGNEIRFGTSDTDAVVLTWYGDTSGDTVVYDEENNMVEFEDIKLAFGDATCTVWGDTIGTGDMVRGINGTNLVTTQVNASTGSITWGIVGDGTDIPFTWAAETANDFFRLTGDDVHLEHMDLCFSDAACILWGNALGTGDIAVGLNAGVLAYTQVAASTGEITYGILGSGIDIPITWAAETTNDYFKLTGDDVHLEHMDLCFSDAACTVWGNALGTGDIVVGLNAAVLAYTQVVEDTGSITYGVPNGTDIPITWYSGTGGNEVTLSGDAWTFDGVDIEMGVDNTANIVWEGTTADGFENTIASNDPTADSTYSWPAGATGTILVPSYRAYTATQSIYATTCWGGIVSNTGAASVVSFYLPSAVAGMEVTFMGGASNMFYVYPGADDQILGLTDAANDRINSPGGIHPTNFVTLHALDTTNWYPVAVCGSWGEE